MALRGKKSKKEFEYDRERIWSMLQGVKLPVLTLDERWMTLFQEMQSDAGVKKIIKRLNELIKEQGGVVNKIKEMKVLKKRLMNNIVENMSDTSDDRRSKKQDANHRLILDINEKMDNSKDRLMDLPYEIMEANRELFFESVIYGYRTISDNQARSKQLEEDIERLKTELAAKVKEKNKIDRENNAMYSFMHDMVGGELLEKFDDEFNIM